MVVGSDVLCLSWTSSRVQASRRFWALTSRSLRYRICQPGDSARRDCLRLDSQDWGVLCPIAPPLRRCIWRLLLLQRSSISWVQCSEADDRGRVHAVSLQPMWPAACRSGHLSKKHCLICRRLRSLDLGQRQRRYTCNLCVSEAARMQLSLCAHMGHHLVSSAL